MADAPKSIRSKMMDPLLNFKFLVSWGPSEGGDLTLVAGVSKIGPLSRSTEQVEYREGGAPTGTRKIPGQTKYDEISLERGIILDTAFEQWANKLWYYQNTDKLGNEVSLKDFRKDIIIEVYNEAGQLAIAYKVYRCWVSEFQALPELDASANAVAIQTLKLENEGWERDAEVAEPSEPTFA